MANALRQLRADILTAIREVSEERTTAAHPLLGALHDEVTVDELVRHFLTDRTDER